MREQLARFLQAATFCLLSALAPSAAHAQSPQTGPVRHTRITGDLDTSQDIPVLKALLADASASHSPLVILELSGNASRPGLVHELASEIRRAPVPVRIYLADADDHV